MYLLDTNTCIFIKNKKPLHILNRLKSVISQNVYISSITIAEMQFGVYNSQSVEKNRVSLTEFLVPFHILAFDDRDAEQFGKTRTALKREGKLIGPYDMLLAAQAVSKALILVTNNTDEFKRIPDLRLEDWK